MLKKTQGYKIRRVNGIKKQDIINKLQMSCFKYIVVDPSKENSIWWIMYYDSDPVGFASISPSRTYPNIGVYLSSAGVLSAHRGKGLQRRLIRARLKYARSLGKKWAISETVLNPSSANNLIACGFRSFQPENPWSYKDAHYWRCRLHD